VRQQRHISNVVAEPGFAGNHRKMGRLRCELISCDFGEVLDLSRTGMRVRLKTLTTVKKGETFALVINGPGARIEVGVLVVWTKKSGLFSGGEAGLEFIELSEDAKRGFAALVRSIMA
jgi:hypothetical protein